MSIEALIGGVIIGILVAVLGGFALAEARGWLPHLQARLVGRAVSKLPQASQERYAEEWSALVADYSDRPVTAFVQAMSLYLKAGSLASELAPAPRAVKPSGKGADMPRGTEKVRFASTAVGRMLILLVRHMERLGKGRSSRWFSWLSLATTFSQRILESSRSAIEGFTRIPVGLALIVVEVLEEATDRIFPPFMVKLLVGILRLGALSSLVIGTRIALGMPLW